MKKKKYFLLTVFVTPMIMCAVIYVSLAFYYQNSFSFGTWVNGIYCTGKSVADINQELCADAKVKQLKILTRDGEETLDLNKINYTEDFITPLEMMKKNQNPCLWGKNLFKSKSQVLIPVISYDSNLLEKEIQAYDFMQTNTMLAAPEVTIIESSEGYQLFDNTRSLIDVQKAIGKIAMAIEDYEQYVDLEKENCYPENIITPEMKATYALWDKVNQFQNFQIHYVFGDTIETLDSTIVADWITVDENGDFVLDEHGELVLNESMIDEYIASLASAYDTIGGTRRFQTTRGDVVTIEGGTYGNQLDQKAEVQYLKEAFLQHNEADRIPEYKETAWKQGTDDIGDTYIEIDMTNQMMYYYLEGDKKLETPVVTGNTSLGRGTPERVCYVYAKQKNRILRGPNYASHVNFWMPVNGGIGIHDAKWRSEFGGDIYIKGGSHGCINTPYDAMAELYDMVEIGTPVLTFY